MIKNIIENSGFIQIKGNVIDLGYANGWGIKTREIYDKLIPYTVLGSYGSTNLGRCVNEYSRVIEDDNERYVLVYRVDSGD
jgi:hypothetical protein